MTPTHEDDTRRTAAADAGRLCIDGSVAAPLALDRADLARFASDEQVADVARLVPGRAGRAVTFAALLERARVRPDAAFVDIASSDPAFAVSLPRGLL